MVSWLLEDMLVDLGCKVVGPAARVGQALAMVDEKIDFAVLDVNLNGEKSFPVADALLARGVPFVFSTGYGREGILDTYQVFPVIQKPYGVAELRKALESLLTGERRST